MSDRHIVKNLSLFQQACRQIGRHSQAPLRFGASLWPTKHPAQPITLPNGSVEVSATPTDEIGRAIKRLSEKKDEWTKVPTSKRATLLSACKENLVSLAKEASQAAAKAHGSYGSGFGDELSSWVSIAIGLSELERAMRQGGRPEVLGLSKKKNGQYVADVTPDGYFAFLFGDTHGEVWIQPGEEPTQGRIYREKQNGAYNPKVALVLGAGNHISVVVLDILHMLFVEDAVVIVKVNPINSSFGQYVLALLKPLFDEGYVEMVHGKAEQGTFICNHPDVDTVHLTGSVDTFNRIVWGSKDPSGCERVLPADKEATGELGCVTPFIVVPGDWSDDELRYQAQSIASGLTQNSSHNCCALELLVTSKGWSKRDRFLSELRLALNSTSRQAAWYLNDTQAFDKFKEGFENISCEELGKNEGIEEFSPWIMAAGVDPENADIRTEHWCGVFQEVCLPECGDDPVKFMKEAVKFANKCWGTLSCSVFIHPATQDAHPEAFETALEQLKFGNITVNGPSSLGFTFTSLSWGAYPGNTLDDIGSGNCTVHNSFLFDHPEKSILYTAWRLQPCAAWAPSVTNKENIFIRMLEFVQEPGLWRVLKIVPELLSARSP
ncbi:hypothetical protein BSKO_03194 [Bryopsis sp. KO-2023]|nr:hypothetical protein BSKO_03194 [Bryopsis sp. KO-2023]